MEYRWGEGQGRSETRMPKEAQERDPLDEILSLAEAAQLSGLAAHTLTQQAEKGRLHARKVGHTWITTRYWLDQYLALHARPKR
jgi:hypothetical protein